MPSRGVLAKIAGGRSRLEHGPAEAALRLHPVRADEVVLPHRRAQRLAAPQEQLAVRALCVRRVRLERMDDEPEVVRFDGELLVIGKNIRGVLRVNGGDARLGGFDGLVFDEHCNQRAPSGKRVTVFGRPRAAMTRVTQGEVPDV